MQYLKIDIRMKSKLLLVISILAFFILPIMATEQLMMLPSDMVLMIKDPGIPNKEKEDKLNLYAKMGYGLDNKSISEICKLIRTDIAKSKNQDLSFPSFLISYIANQPKVSQELIADELKQLLLFYLKIDSYDRDFARKLFLKYNSILFSDKCDKPFLKQWKICQYIFLNYIPFFEYLMATKDVNCLSACYSNLPKYVKGSFTVLSSPGHDALKISILESFLAPNITLRYYLQKTRIKTLALLSNNKNQQISNKSQKILESIVLLPKNPLDWEKWWKTNSYSIPQKACVVLSNKRQSEKNRIVAIEQILMANHFFPKELPDDYLNTLLRVLHSDITKNLEIKILATLQSLKNIKNNEQSKIISSILNNLNSENNCLICFNQCLLRW